MRKLFIFMLLLPAALLPVTCGTGSGSRGSAVIHTAYYDLPAQYAEQMKKLLKTESLKKLNYKSAKRLLSFFKNSVVDSTKPNGPLITSNYFWHIYLALPDFVDTRERHHGYYMSEEAPLLENQLMAYACYRIDRSPVNLDKIFTIIKPKLLKLLSVEQYDIIGARDYVSGLIGCYNRLKHIKRAREKLTAFYNATYTDKGALRTNADSKILKMHDNSAYGFSGYELANMLSDYLKIDRYSSYYCSPCLSFWMRRNAEGNMDTVYRILCEIERMYEQ
ncbi:MAG TPA: hypothetical protein PK358_08705 [Spirochaetota bacterium]|nr:hypothetical protein [Spirochaetota bacterium]